MAGSPELPPRTQEEINKSLESDVMLFCPKCGSRYNRKLKKCPECGEKNPKRKGGFSKVLGTILIVFGIFMFLIGFIGSLGSSTSSSSKVSNKEIENYDNEVEVVIADFSSMTSEEILAWGDENKINIEITQEYSNQVADGEFISQSIEANKTAYQGDEVKVIYSMGVEPSKEYQNALKKAESYSRTMHMSKQGIYHQLTSEYGEQFPTDAAEWAMEHLVADWNANALAKAESYSDSMHMSKQGIYDQLVSEYGEQFTAEEAQYAIDNIDADWNANALSKAKSYQDSMSMSKSAIYDQLVSEYGEQFTAEEAQYAIDHLDD